MGSVLITGSGSLGEEFIKFLEKKVRLIVIDSHEETIARLSNRYPDVKFILEDFSEWKFDQDPIDCVVHTAAYKHLPLGEENPNAFIDNNIIKTRKLFAEAYKNNADLLFISSDKAVEPCSLYGYTKAIGESLAKYYNFAIARCGNFLNSSGSVIPVWEDAIKNDEPIPVTDLKMKRFYCEMDKAVRDIWNAFAKDGTRFIIPKSEELELNDLLNKTLERHGIKVYSKGIKIIGPRPNEKLMEKLRWPNE